MTGSDKSGWDHVASELAVPPLCTCNWCIHLVMWGWFRPCFSTPGYEHYFCIIIIKINFHIFLLLSEIILYYFVMAFHKFLEPNVHYTLKMYSDICDGVTNNTNWSWMSILHCTKADKKYLEQFFIETLLIEPKCQTMRDIWWRSLPYKMDVLEKKGFYVNFCLKCGRRATKTWDATTSTRRNSTESIQDMPVVLQF